jgi:AraC-like DNA-binding protein/tetratricopeptide (TPR) repeat protein
LDVIGRRLYDPAFNVEELERSCRVTPRVRRLFRAELGVTPKKYMTRHKMETGLWLLVHTDLEVWMIAEDLGYTRTGNFSRDFKAWAKRTPMEVREAARPASSRWLPGSVSPDFAPWCVAGSPPEAAHETLDRLPNKPRTRPLDWRPEDGAEAAARLLAVSVWETLEGRSPEEQEELVRTSLRLDSPALFELLSEKSREHGRRDRQRGVELAELALASVEACAEELGDRAVDLRALGWARLANALLFAGEIKKAERAMLRAESEWTSSRGENDYGVEAEILALKGVLRQHQRRFEEALDLINESIALCRVLRRERLLTQLLLQRVTLMIYSETAEGALPDLYEAQRLLADRDEPYLCLSVVQDLALVSALTGDHENARQFLRRAREECVVLDLRSNRHQLEWIEGLICMGEGNLDAACDLFRKARSGFVVAGDFDSAASAALQTALVCILQERTAEALNLASEAIPILEAQHSSPEAVTCARSLRDAILERHLSRQLLRRALKCLRGSQVGPRVPFAS